MIHIENLICDYLEGNGRHLRALDIPSFELPDHGSCALIGPSGSGKSTFFHCLSGLLRPTAGRIVVDGTVLNEMEEEALASWRAAHVGYIFQQALLMPFLTVMENILLAADMAGRPREEARREGEKWLQKTGLAGCGDRLPSHLSGGERQRVGFIRAVLTKPSLLLADEPTASLDVENSRLVMQSLLQYQQESGCMLLCATHDPSVQALFSNQFHLAKRGREE